MRNPSELTRINSQIAFTTGILIGAIAGGVLILFFTQWQWYFKLFSAIGSLGIIGTLSMGINDLFKHRKSYIEAEAEMAKINAEANNHINNQKGGNE